MRPWSHVVLVAGVLWAACPGRGFNLEPREGQVFGFPGNETQEREPYFGFAVALQKQQNITPAWLVVGAPRANSTEYLPDNITEPGAVFKCSLEGHECEELVIDKQGMHGIYQNVELKTGNKGLWLGGFLDTQPTYQKDRQATAVCAPRWQHEDKDDYQNYLMTGICYVLNNLTTPAFKKLKPDQSSFARRFNGTHTSEHFDDKYGQLALAVHFPDDPTELLLGIPSDNEGRGTVARYKDKGSGTTPSNRRRRSASRRMFSRSFIPKLEYMDSVELDDYTGYAVSSGRYRREDELLYAAGAPRGADCRGKVIIFNFTLKESPPLVVVQELVGDQLGANFGAALATADINGDGLSDMVVGAPMFSLKDLPDVGTIRVLLSTKPGELLQLANTTYHGTSVSFARFGTTLASLGDLNADGYQDVAVGAPFEEGSGAVYIFLGSRGGLRSPHSQRLAPEDFTLSLSGFGMALSRGIDVDDNDYPDLAIGSFLSGHAVVVRSRPVATLDGSVTANPSSISLKEKFFNVTSCIRYGGHKVPQQLVVKGNVTLDPQSSRAFFTDNKAFSHNFTDTLELNESSCLTFPVQLQDRPINPHEPFELKLDFQVVESNTTSYVSQPIADPTTTSGVTSRIRIVTGCEEDGNETCRIDLRLETSFMNYGDGKELVIGEDQTPVLNVLVSNVGEPAYLTNITVKVAPPLALFLPNSHDCSFPEQGQRFSVVCNLSSPIATDGQDTIQVPVDAGNLTDTSSQVDVSVDVAGDGVEIQQLDNTASQSLQLQAQASLSFHAYSKEEQVRYTLDEAGNINSTEAATINHKFVVVKKGPTPVEAVEVDISIPVRFKGGRTFLKMFNISTKYECQWSGVELIEEGVVVPTVTRTTPVRGRVVEGAGNFNCSSGEMECGHLHCRVDFLAGGIESADFSLKLSIQLDVLGGHMSPMLGGVLKTSATASITSLNPNITYNGTKTATIEVATQIQPESLVGSGVPWWIILLAVLGGLLLLALLAYGLYKAGFFKRKDLEEMRAQVRRAEPTAET